MRTIFCALFVLVAVPARATTITTTVGLELLRADLPADGVLAWISDLHLRTAALYEAVSGWEPTGATARPRVLIVEEFRDGLYVYTVDMRRITDNCGRIQFDLESVAGGPLAAGVGAYAVLDLGPCVSVTYSIAEPPSTVAEPRFLGIAGLACFWMALALRKRTV